MNNNEIDDAAIALRKEKDRASHNAAQANYRAANLEKVKAKQAGYYIVNLEKLKAKKAKYYAENPEKIRAS